VISLNVYLEVGLRIVEVPGVEVYDWTQSEQGQRGDREGTAESEGRTREVLLVLIEEVPASQNPCSHVLQRNELVQDQEQRPQELRREGKLTSNRDSGTVPLITESLRFLPM